METIKRLLENKPAIVTISPDDTVFQALRVMAEKNIGALLALERGKLVGIFSERDYARKVILEGKSSRETKVADIMTRKVVFATSDQTVEECMAMMTEFRIRHLPVFEDDKLTGIISIGDIVKEVIAHQQFVISQLENYITGYR